MLKTNLIYDSLKFRIYWKLLFFATLMYIFDDSLIMFNKTTFLSSNNCFIRLLLMFMVAMASFGFNMLLLIMIIFSEIFLM